MIDNFIKILDLKQVKTKRDNSCVRFYYKGVR